MRRETLGIASLALACFGLAAGLDAWFVGWEGNRAQSGDLLTVAMGDGRKLFARHFYAKADAYFHSGYYPSIFDYEPGRTQDALGRNLGYETGAAGEESCGTDFLGPPRDWIDGFSRNFYPTRHVHLGAEPAGHVHDEHCAHDHGHDHDHDHDHGHVHDEHCQHGPEPGHGHEQPAGARPSPALKEILPWVRMSAALDPENADTYLIGAYWLRTEMEKPAEAEQFLREGLRALPAHPALLFELGRIHHEDHRDAGRARNLWELALRRWREGPGAQPEPEVFLCAQILGNLARLEEQTGNPARALEHLRELRSISPHPDSIQQWIDEVGAKAP